MNMKLAITILAMTLAISSGFASKKLHPRISKAEATKIVNKEFKGAVIEGSELEKEEGRLVWSFDLKVGTATKEVWVDAKTGKVIKTEEESTAKENQERVTDQAEEIALRKIPGDIVKSTVKTRKGKPICSVEILTKAGKTVEVDIDPRTNKVVEIETEEAAKKE
jgi:uncharacterized membrane protein YkoI